MTKSAKRNNIVSMAIKPELARLIVAPSDTDADMLLRDAIFIGDPFIFLPAKGETHPGPERSGDRSSEEECKGGRVCHVQPARTRSAG